MTFWRFWSLSERLGEYFGFFFGSIVSLSSRLVVYLSGLLVKGKKNRITLGIIREMTRREGDGWLYKSIVKKELTLTLYVFSLVVSVKH